MTPWGRSTRTLRSSWHRPGTSWCSKPCTPTQLCYDFALGRSAVEVRGGGSPPPRGGQEPGRRAGAREGRSRPLPPPGSSRSDPRTPAGRPRARHRAAQPGRAPGPRYCCRDAVLNAEAPRLRGDERECRRRPAAPRCRATSSLAPPPPPPGPRPPPPGPARASAGLACPLGLRPEGQLGEAGGMARAHGPAARAPRAPAGGPGPRRSLRPRAPAVSAAPAAAVAPGPARAAGGHPAPPPHPGGSPWGGPPRAPSHRGTAGG